MLAADRGLAEVDERAFDLSVASFEMIEGDLDTDPTDSTNDPEFLRRLANGLILSGESMIIAGTSRPASGGEHEISHAIDELYGGRAMHGAQVAFGTLFSASIYGEDTDLLRGRLRRLGLPQAPEQLGFTTDDLVRILLRAPDTRPGRFTILEEADLDDGKARALIARIWGDD
jgi:glycerol-1-phosphate dehydrogenase [NAD(P)+]